MKKRLLLTCLVFVGIVVTIVHSGRRRHRAYWGHGPIVSHYRPYPWEGILSTFNTAILASSLDNRSQYNRQVKELFDQVSKALQEQGKAIADLRERVARLEGPAGPK